MIVQHLSYDANDFAFVEPETWLLLHEKLRWTSTGTVDYRKTAEALVRSDVVDIVKRYKLACLYCLEDYIPEFWKELPEENKGTFYHEKATSLIAELPLHFCWPYILKGEEYKLDFMPRSSFGRTWIRRLEDPSRTRFHQYAFQHSSFIGNKTAAEYFFQKLTHEQRDASLVQTAVDVVRYRTRYFRIAFQLTKGKFSDVLSYLLSQMTPEEQIQIFKELPCEILRCFMEWPCQNLFFDLADVIWTFLPESNYKDLLSEIYWIIEDSGYYHPNLLQNLFLRSPIDFGKHFVDEECRIGYFFEEFFDNQDTETIKVIFRTVDAADRVKLVFDPYVLKLFYKYISKDRWHMVEVCLREATLSKDDKDRFKEYFMGLQSSSKWRRFCECLDETDASSGSKRSSDDETLTKVKKLCCEEEEIDKR
ncbi:hypothetical protein AVEN_3176-1 [Araneus ventricosus]|uniref:Uncharacterized protein n=1 Tax=Araneus ventricosus TaxID=182803 RepID=A0A4Y2KGJ1_ARAVE|nr:hypothetical protein AVEN_3176-1 [Araneus ventricosus]